jgi:Arc/MetJ-type ribon-helix-helix transcriptional regulator
MIEVELPPTLVVEIDALVATGAFPTRDHAIAELLRLGLDALRSRMPRPPLPPRPPAPPGHRDPAPDEPIRVDESDVNWAGGAERARRRG